MQRGVFDLADCAARYAQYLKRLNKNGDVNDGRARLVSARASLLELRLAKERGEFIPLDVYRAVLFQNMNTVRERMLRIPQIASELVGMDREQIQGALEAAVREALTSLAEGNHIPSEPLPNAQNGRVQGGI